MAESKRTEYVTLSLTQSELDELNRAADRMGIPRATHARLGALEKARRELGERDAERQKQTAQ
jgi:hypothetical protein